MWDIVYSEFNRFRDAREDKKEQLHIAKGLVKKALLKFYLDWTSYRNNNLHNTSEARDILSDYAKLYIDVSVEVYEVLPLTLITEVTGTATRIREAVNELKFVSIGDTLDEIFSIPDECAQEAYRIYEKFDEYFQDA